MRCVPLLVALLLLGTSGRADLIPYQATIQLRVSSGQDTTPTTVIDVAFSGLADIDEGVVRIPAGDLSTPVVVGTSFGGILLNGPLTLSAGGAGVGSTCPLIGIQERCIEGGGFGGLMPLSGITQRGQELAAWGAGTTSTGMTSHGLTRAVEGTRWTTGVGRAFFYVPELDPTPFAFTATGSFIGLPSTFTGSGDPGFRVVTPMVVTGSTLSSTPNARGVALLTLRFAPTAAPLGIGLTLATILSMLGFVRLRARRSVRLSLSDGPVTQLFSPLPTLPCPQEDARLPRGAGHFALIRQRRGADRAGMKTGKIQGPVRPPGRPDESADAR